MCELSGENMDRKEFTSVFLNNMVDERLHYFVAEVNNVPAAFASLSIQNHLHHASAVAEIQELVVMPEFRNSGVGKQLLNHLILLAGEKKCCMVELASSKARTHAHRFYTREGFTETHFKFTRKIG
jgi:PhnO protein